MKKNAKNRGWGMLEIIVVVAIIGFALTALAGLGNYALKISSQLKNNVIATNLAAEAIETAQAVKNENWNLLANLSEGLPYHPEKSGSPPKWVLVSGSENINGFSRRIVLSPVLRDSNDDIALTGNLDPQTKKITATVSWNETGTDKQISLTVYLTNWKP